jgi:hypothetical protein
MFRGARQWHAMMRDVGRMEREQKESRGGGGVAGESTKSHRSERQRFTECGISPHKRCVRQGGFASAFELQGQKASYFMR